MGALPPPPLPSPARGEGEEARPAPGALRVANPLGMELTTVNVSLAKCGHRS